MKFSDDIGYAINAIQHMDNDDVEFFIEYLRRVGKYVEVFQKYISDTEKNTYCKEHANHCQDLLEASKNFKNRTEKIRDTFLGVKGYRAAKKP